MDRRPPPSPLVVCGTLELDSVSANPTVSTAESASVAGIAYSVGRRGKEGLKSSRGSIEGTHCKRGRGGGSEIVYAGGN